MYFLFIFFFVDIFMRCKLTETLCAKMRGGCHGPITLPENGTIFMR